MEKDQVPAEGQVDPVALARAVKAKRQAEGLSLRQASDLLGVSPSTLSRVEGGGHLPDRENLLRLARWTSLALTDEQRRRRNRDVHAPDASTMEAVELHLRADKEIEADDADMLVDIMRTAYARVRERRGRQG
jgi:transcriptional regulator with XRE-family HTH domain